MVGLVGEVNVLLRIALSSQRIWKRAERVAEIGRERGEASPAGDCAGERELRAAHRGVLAVEQQPRGYVCKVQGAVPCEEENGRLLERS